MKKTKQICAIIGIILLVALYVSTLVFALMDSPNSMALLKVSIYATVVIPVLIWAMGLVARILKKNYSQHPKVDADKASTDVTDEEAVDPDTDSSVK